MRYVALLRGINVGGNNKIDMKKLKLTFENIGFTDVVTYINSGNIIFTDVQNTPQDIIDMIEVAIELNFDLQIKTLVRNAESIQTLITALPESWTNDKDMKSDVMFLWGDVDTEDVLKQLKPVNGIDTVKYVPGAVLWSVCRQNVSKSGMQHLVGTKLCKQMTIRNVNTVRKIIKLL